MEKLYYKTVESYLKYEIPKIKWSRFFATIFPIQDTQEALYKIKKVQEKYSDATHNCYAYTCGISVNTDLFANTILTSKSFKYSDDWEPMNTAGKPILSVIEWLELHDVAVVVTRYFGGTLLWIWGLIQAYSDTAKYWLQNTKIIEKEILENLSFNFEYNYTGVVMNLISKYWWSILSQDCKKDTHIKISINQWVSSTFRQELLEKTNASVIFS